MGADESGATTSGRRPVLTAAAMIEAASFGYRPPPTVVVVFDEALVPARGRRRADHPFRQVATIGSRRSEPIDLILAPGPGAPVAAVTVEFLAALGATRIVTVGSCGVLDGTGGPDGSRPLVIRSAESDEGTSKHYGGNRSPDPTLTGLLAEELGAQSVTTITTDAPFRQTPARLAAFRRLADVVEMEAAACFAAAHLLGVAAASVLVAGDRFVDDTWRPAPPDTAERLARTLANVVDALAVPS